MDNFIDKFAQRRHAQEMIRANAMAEAKERESMAEKLSEYEAALQEMRRCNLQNIENTEKVKELLAASLLKIGEAKERGGVAPENAEGELKALFEELTGQVTRLLDEQKERTAGLLERQQGWMAELLERQQDWMAGLLEKQQARTAQLLEAQRGQTTEALERQQAKLMEFLEAQRGQLSEVLERQQARTEELFAERKKEAEDFGHKEAVKVYRNVQAVVEGALPKQTAEITEALKAAEKKGGAPKGMVALGILTFLAAAGSAAIEVLRMLGYL